MPLQSSTHRCHTCTHCCYYSLEVNLASFEGLSNKQLLTECCCQDHQLKGLKQELEAVERLQATVASNMEESIESIQDVSKRALSLQSQMQSSLVLEVSSRSLAASAARLVADGAGQLRQKSHLKFHQRRTRAGINPTVQAQ